MVKKKSARADVFAEGLPKGAPEPVMGLAEVRRTPGYLMRRAHQLANAAYAVELGSEQITGVQFVALVAIKDEPDLSGVGIADRIGYDKMTTSRILRGLEKKGFIKRRPSETDRRETLIRCTQAGERIVPIVAAQLPVVEARVMEPLSRAESEQLLALLEKLEVASRKGAQVQGGIATESG